MGELKKCFTIEGGAVGQIKVVNLLSEYQCGNHWSNHNLMKPLVLGKDRRSLKVARGAY